MSYFPREWFIGHGDHSWAYARMGSVTLIRQGVRYSAIDHMLVNGMQIPTNDCKARVIRDWDGSDHLPLFAKIPLTFQQRDNGNQWQPVRGKRFVARNIQRCPASVISEIRDLG